MVIMEEKMTKPFTTVAVDHQERAEEEEEDDTPSLSGISLGLVGSAWLAVLCRRCTKNPAVLLITVCVIWFPI